MMTMLDQLVDFEYHAAAPYLVPWFGEAALRAAVQQEVAECAANAINVEPGGSAALEDGKRYLLTLDRGECCIVLYQRQADNITLPHFLVLKRSFDITAHDNAAQLRLAVRTIDQQQQVQQCCFFQHGEHPLLEDTFRLRSHYLAAEQRTIATASDIDDARTLRAVEPESVAFYDEYMQWYQEFWRRRPDLEPHVRVESLEDIQQYHQGGGLRLILLDDEVCGLMAALRQIEHGMIGWRIREKVIAPRFWGRGLSVASNALFARSLPHEPHFAMWGTIAPDNAASLRSAQRVGRRIIGSTYWLDV